MAAASVTQIEVVPALLDAYEIEPGCVPRQELNPFDHARTPGTRRSTRELRRDGKEELIDQPLSDETTKQAGAAFVQQ